MSQRSMVRSIAKARLEAMGVPHVNKVMGLGLSHTKNRRLQKTFTGRKILDRIHKYHIHPAWRRVTSGSLATDGYRAQIGVGKKRKYHVTQ